MNNLLFEYIWLDAKNDFRSKTKVITSDKELDVTDLPVWNYDGSSTGQAEGTDSEVFLQPVAIFNDPFRQNMKSYLVWCNTIDKNNHLMDNCHRPRALEIFTKYQEEEPWFGLEQEYFIIDPATKQSIGFKHVSGIVIIPEQQGKYYCSVGPDRALGRHIPETHLEYCLYAGIQICGVNAEVAPGQWEYQIGPCVGINAGDHLWVSRYILNRVAENVGYEISYHPKPLGQHTNWNGSGCHTNFSTKDMRNENGINYIYKSIMRLSQTHLKHMENYGSENHLRMSGLHETSKYNKFTYGRANRGASVRIPNQVLKENKGYFEDRRPAANCDPYLVTSLILETTMDNSLDEIIRNREEFITLHHN